jgi:hypothetical protein
MLSPKPPRAHDDRGLPTRRRPTTHLVDRTGEVEDVEWGAGEVEAHAVVAAGRGVGPDPSKE